MNVAMESSRSVVRILSDCQGTPLEGAIVVLLKAGEEWQLVSKPSDNCWLICKDENSKQIYVPAQCVREVRMSAGNAKSSSVRNSSFCPRPVTKPKPKIGGVSTSSMEESVLKEFDDVLDLEERSVSPGASCESELSGGQDGVDVNSTVSRSTSVDTPVDGQQSTGTSGSIDLCIPPPDYEVDDECDSEDYVNLSTVKGYNVSTNVNSEPSQVQSAAAVTLDDNSTADVNFQPFSSNNNRMSDYYEEPAYANFSEIQKAILSYDAPVVKAGSKSPPIADDIVVVGAVCSTTERKSEKEKAALKEQQSPTTAVQDTTLTKSKQLPLKLAQKQGHLHRLKVMDAGKKSKKGWSLSYVFLFDDKLHFFKDQKIANRPRSLSSLGKPENSLDLCGATVKSQTTADKNKKEVVEITTADATQYLIHHNDPAALLHWKQTLENNILVLKSRQTLQESKQGASSSGRALTLNSVSDGERQPFTGERVKYADKLKNWLKRRPTCDELRASGIYKDVVFGTQLSVLCQNEASLVPRFVQECIVAVDNRGLTVGGIYRVGGNLASVQKLRIMVDQHEYYDLNSNEWDINVVTSALKLFLRELPEPLFTFEFYPKFLETLSVGNRQTQLAAIHSLVHKLPRCHYDTLKLLFTHLRRVILNSHDNKMLPQNLAIVFGPTLLRSPADNDNLVVSLVQQGQLVELILVESQSLFD